MLQILCSFEVRGPSPDLTQQPRHQATFIGILSTWVVGHCPTFSRHSGFGECQIIHHLHVNRATLKRVESLGPGSTCEHIDHLDRYAPPYEYFAFRTASSRNLSRSFVVGHPLRSWKATFVLKDSFFVTPSPSIVDTPPSPHHSYNAASVGKHGKVT